MAAVAVSYLKALVRAGPLIRVAPGTAAPPVCVVADVVSAAEEDLFASQLLPLLRKRKYSYSHYDKVIEGYRELERPRAWFTDENQRTMDRIAASVFGAQALPKLLPPHTLELEAGPRGVIRAHVDHVGVSGLTIIGLSLLADSVMRLTRVDDPSTSVLLFLRARSLYVLHGEARYDWKHEILPDVSLFPRDLRTDPHAAAPTSQDAADAKQRRLAVILRTEATASGGV
jgi:alkylated DNA repair protein alkB family protein 7